VLEIDDREPVLSNRTETSHESSLGIRAAVALTGQLRPDDLLGGSPRLAHEPGDSAHVA
jgi:hypothetical protein